MSDDRGSCYIQRARCNFETENWPGQVKPALCHRRALFKRSKPIPICKILSLRRLNGRRVARSA